jgi:hypothetical protein
VILFGSADQDPLTFEGTRLQWAWVDEPVKPFVFNGLWRGLSVDQGRIFFTLTPLGVESAWMYDKWVSNTPDDVGYVKVLMTDNPGLTPQAIEEFERTGEWTEAERKARLCGDFEALGNRVIYNFDKKVHVVPAHRLPVDWTHGMTVDPHHARPPFAVWWKRSPDGVYEFYREYPTQSWTKACRSGVGIPPTELAILFRNIEAADIPNWRIGDPRFAKAETNLKGQLMTSWAQDMAAAGMPFDTRVPNVGRVETGEQQIVDMLRYNDKFPISPTNTPKILIHDCCVNLIKAFENYGILTSRTNVKLDEKRSEEWKDPIDCVRYTVLFPAYDDVGTGKRRTLQMKKMFTVYLCAVALIVVIGCTATEWGRVKDDAVRDFPVMMDDLGKSGGNPISIGKEGHRHHQSCAEGPVREARRKERRGARRKT